MVVDELITYLKERMLERSGAFSTLVIERFFRILSDSKQLLSIGSDGEFVLSLMLFKMIEATNIQDIDAMIKTLEGELKGIMPTPQESISQANQIHQIPSVKENKFVSRLSIIIIIIIIIIIFLLF